MAWLEDISRDYTISSVFLQGSGMLGNVFPLSLPHFPFSFILAALRLYHSIKP